MEQPAFFGCGQHRDRIRRARRAQIRAFERIDGNVDLIPLAAILVLFLREADLFADVEHRRFVTLAFADDDGAVDRDGVHFAPHRLNGNLIGTMAIALAHGVCAGNGGLFGDAKKL